MRDKSLNSGERQLADGIEPWHRWRYKETLPYIKDKTVLDVGCGIGFGSYIMAISAKEVYGIDDSDEAIEFAQDNYDLPNIKFSSTDFMNFDHFIPAHIDVVVAFEFIEHIKNTDKLFDVFNQIRPAKLFIISTPHLKCPMGSNKFHHRHYGMDEIVDRFWNIGYKPKRAELVYFGGGLCNFFIGERK